MTTIPGNKLAASLWLLVVVSALAYVAVNIIDDPPVDSSIMALLPTQSQRPLTAKTADITNSQFSSMLVFVLGAPAENKMVVTKVASQFAKALTESKTFTEVRQHFEEIDEKEILEPYRSYHYQLLDRETRDWVENNQIPRVVNAALQDIYSPFSAPRLFHISEDPMNLFGRWLRFLPLPPRPQADASGIYVEEAGMYYRIIIAEYAGDAFDLGVQDRILLSVDTAISKIDSRQIELNQIELYRSGLIFHAAEGADLAITELSTIGLGSLGGIIVLMLLLFGRLRIIAVALLPIIVGCVLALAACIFFLDSVHMVTLAFGASLVGVSVDYILHYLCAHSSAKHTRVKILPALSLGLLSSVIAYCSFALTPFPGLQQMALFAVSGLISSWLTVVLWFPLISDEVNSTIILRIEKLEQIRARTSLRRALILPAVVVPLLVLCLGFVFAFETEDDIRTLNSSSPELLSNEQKVQKLLKAPALGQYFIVEGQHIQEILEREERLTNHLNDLISNGLIRSYQAVSTSLPSLALQQRNVRAVHDIYQSDGGLRSFTENLGLVKDKTNEAIDLFQQAAKSRLEYNEWQHWTIADLNKQLIIFDENDTNVVGSIVLLYADLDGQKIESLRHVAKNLEGTTFIDRPGEISQILSSYRVQVAYWLAGVYTLLLVILYLRFRRYSFLVVLTPLLATLAAMGTILIAGQPLTLFHLLGSVLVLGIGLDMGIFLYESKGASHALIAVNASAITTILAFGLLALSETPILHYFGQTVLLGIFFSWLLAMTFNMFYHHEGSILEM